MHQTHIDETGMVHVSAHPIKPPQAIAHMVAAIPKTTADKIQLDMVAKALARKFPDSDSDSDSNESRVECNP